jgi:hypothetical protein
MSLAGAVLFILVGLVTLSAYSHPGTESFIHFFLWVVLSAYSRLHYLILLYQSGVLALINFEKSFTVSSYVTHV